MTGLVAARPAELWGPITVLTFATLVPQVEQLSAEMQLTFSNPDALRQQLAVLPSKQAALAALQAEIQPYHDRLQAAVDRLNAIAIARGAVVVGKLLLGAGGDDDDDGWLEGLLDFGEDSLEIWEFFEADNVKNADLIRSLYQQIHGQYQQITTRTQQAQRLTQLAEACLADAQLWESLRARAPEPPTLHNLGDRWQALRSAAQWRLPFQQHALDPDRQLAQLEAQLDEIQAFQTALASLQDRLDGDTLTPPALSQLAAFYNASELGCGFDEQDRPTIAIDGQPYDCGALKAEIQQLTATLATWQPKLASLQQLAQRFTAQPTGRQLWSQHLPERDFASVVRAIERAIAAAPQSLQFGSGSSLSAQLTQLQTSHAMLKRFQQHLQILLVASAPDRDLPIEPRALQELLRLCGRSVTALGFDGKGRLVLQPADGSAPLVWETVRQECDRLHQRTKTAIAQEVHLGRIAQQCVKSETLAQQLARDPAVVPFATLERQIKVLGQQARRKIDFLTTHRQIRLQAEQAQQAIAALQATAGKLTKLRQPGTGAGTDRAVNLVALNAFVSLFGGFQALGFDSAGQLVVTQAGESRPWRIYGQQCTQLNHKIARDLTFAQQSVQVAQNSRTDRTLYRQLTANQRRSRLLKRGLVAAGAAIALGLPIGAIATAVQGRQTYARAQTLLQQVDMQHQAGDLSILETVYLDLEQASRLLAAVPQFPGSPYQQSQIDLADCQARMNRISGQYHQVKQAKAELARARGVAEAASALTASPPYPLSTWETAETKWSEAIAILEATRATLVSQLDNADPIPELEPALTDYRQQRTRVQQNIKWEKQAARREYDAEQLMAEVKVLRLNTGSGNQAAAGKKCQAALQLLAEVPPQVSRYQQIQRQQATYQQQCQAIAPTQLASTE